MWRPSVWSDFEHAAAQRRHPLALGHMANHPGKADIPNVMIAAFDYFVPRGVNALLHFKACVSENKTRNAHKLLSRRRMHGARTLYFLTCPHTSLHDTGRRRCCD